MIRRPLGLLAVLAMEIACGAAAAQTKVNIDVDLRDNGPRITQFRSVRRFGWHSGLHYAPYIDATGVSRVGWHQGRHLDWYVIDVPVMSKVDNADWDVFVNLGRNAGLRVRGDMNRVVNQSNIVQAAPGGTVVGWTGPDGRTMAGGPNTRFRKRFVGNGWDGFDLGDSIIMMDLPGSPGVEVYLKKRTKDVVAGKEPVDPRTAQAERKPNPERDALLDDADQQFVRGLYPQAALLYQKALKLDENDAIARFAVAHSLFALGVYKTAGQNVRLGLDKYPDWGLVNLELVKFYKNEATFFNQLVALKKYVADHPDDRDATLLLGYCYYFSGSRKDGLAVFKALADSPGGDRHAQLFLNMAEYETYTDKKEP